MRRKKIDSKDLGINLKSKKESEIFKWFLACLLFGKPIRQEVAKRTFFEFKKERLLSPRAILKAGWKRLVKALGRGHYVRFDESTATKLLDVSKLLTGKYGGHISRLYDSADNKRELRQRLEEFKGIGPTTVRIFLRDMKSAWPKAA